jgi:transposase InsO family protein
VRFTWIEAKKDVWPVRQLCRALRVSTSGYYAWRTRPESARSLEDLRLGVLVEATHKESHGRYGSPRVHAKLKKQGKKVSRKRIIRLMQANGLQGKCRRSRIRTTDSRHDLPVAPNLLDRDFTADGPNEKWVGDVTYLRTPEGWLYLAVVLDLYSRFVVGWAMGAVNDRWLALKALDMAVQRRRPGHGLLAHTDRGSPYASEDYQKVLKDLGIECSMSRKGNCYDNAAMESFFARLKVELGESFESHADAWRQVFEYLEVFYNQQRLHSSNGYRSPAEFERQVFA